MLTTHYQTVFGISTSGYKEWQFVIISGLLVVANVIVLFFFGNAGFRISLHVFTGLVVLFSCILPFWEYSRLKRAFLRNKYQVAEGKVENYWQKEWYNRFKKQHYSYESFTVNGITFSYYRRSDASFQNFEENRLPIRNSMTMRICYLAETPLDSDKKEYRILKLETGKEETKGLKAGKAEARRVGTLAGF
jgi:hypothetical protein